MADYVSEKCLTVPSKTGDYLVWADEVLTNPGEIDMWATRSVDVEEVLEQFPPRLMSEKPLRTAVAIAERLSLHDTGRALHPATTWSLDPNGVICRMVQELEASGLQVLRVDTHEVQQAMENELVFSDQPHDRICFVGLLDHVLVWQRSRRDAEWSLWGVRRHTPLEDAQVMLMHASLATEVEAAGLTEITPETVAAVELSLVAQLVKHGESMAAPEERDDDLATWNYPDGVPHHAMTTLRALLEVATSHQDKKLPEESQPQRPAPRLIRTARDAELLAAEWMLWMGFEGANATPVGPDGGVDIEAHSAVAQVKAESVPVGRPPLQAIYGIGAARGKQPLFFSLSGYTGRALDWANEVELPLFEFDFQGEPVPVNAAAESCWPG